MNLGFAMLVYVDEENERKLLKYIETRRENYPIVAKLSEGEWFISSLDGALINVPNMEEYEKLGLNLTLKAVSHEDVDRLNMKIGGEK